MHSLGFSAVWDSDSGNGFIGSSDTDPSARVTVGSGQAPAMRRVLLLNEQTGMTVRATWSDGQGRYRFENLNLNRTYIVMALDHTAQFHPYAVAGVVPFSQSA